VGSASKPQNGHEVSDHELPVNQESTLVCHSVRDHNDDEECVWAVEIAFSIKIIISVCSWACPGVLVAKS
jgi:hypothetical protein